MAPVLWSFFSAVLETPQLTMAGSTLQKSPESNNVFRVSHLEEEKAFIAAVEEKVRALLRGILEVK